MGLKKGDVVATTLPLLKEHVYLMYACMRIGAIFAPLDLRLKVEEFHRVGDAETLAIAHDRDARVRRSRLRRVAAPAGGDLPIEWG